MKGTNLLQQIQEGRIKHALQQMQSLAVQYRAGHLHTHIDNLLTNYDLLSQYYMAGAKDPERGRLLQKIKQESSLIWEELQEEIRITDAIGFPYSQIRDSRNSREVVSVDIFQNYHEGVCSRSAYEDMLRRLFNTFLTAIPLTSSQEELYNKIIFDASFDANEKCLAVTAISLNLWRKWDKVKCSLLFNTLRCDHIETGMRALCGICLSILLDPDKYTASDLYALLMDYPTLNRKIEALIRFIIRTAGTKRLSEKLRTEILPDLMKAGQKMQDRFEELSKDEDYHPEWMNSDNTDDIEAKIREFGELQMSGADVYFANFSELKRLSFFQLPHAWFLPFDKRHTAVSDLFSSNGKSVLDAFIENGALCNSDKYSFCLSIKQMPESQRQLIQSQLGGELEEQMNEGVPQLNAEEKWMRSANQYIQDLYRFFVLFPALAKQNRNPFHLSLEWSQTPLFTDGVLSMTQQITIADKLFAEHYYVQARAIYQVWEKDSPSASLYQKMGYATEKLSGNSTEALEFYRKADLLQPNDKWTLKHMAGILYAQEKYTAALHIYEELHKLTPDDPRITIKLCHCQGNMNLLEEALQTAFKIYWEHPNYIPAVIAIGDFSFQVGNHEQAQRYWETALMLSEQDTEKTLHIGVGLWSIGQRKRAQEVMRKILDTCTDEQRAVHYHTLKQRMLRMGEKGIDLSEIELFLDWL